MIIDIGLTLFLVFLNGFFVAAEFAIVKVRSSQIELRIRAGNRFAPMARTLVTHLDEYLSATQLGITLASLGLGWIGESVVAELIKNLMLFFNIELTAEMTHNIALPVAFVTITILHIVFGELAPKSIAIQKAEQTSLAVALPLRMFYILFKPFIWLLNSFANWIIRRIGIHPASEEEETHSEEELRYLLEESEKSGIIDTNEHEMLEKVFDFSETPVKQVMVPRGKIAGVEAKMTNQEIFDTFIEQGFSRIPVFEKTIDNIIGIVYAKDLIAHLRDNSQFDISELMRRPYYVSEGLMINELLRHMQLRKIHVAIVLDEFGGTAGLVTLEDIIEEIVGEIQDEYDEEQPIIVKTSENEYIIRAEATIDDVNDVLDTPLPEDDDYESVGGLVISELGRIPEVGETIEISGYKCIIIERGKRSLSKVRLVGQPDEEENFSE